jgi:hypothetical protein
MTKLYLHIGTHKTATSAIQQYFYKHSDDLKKENLKILKHSDLPMREEFRKSDEVSKSLIDAYKAYFENVLKNDKHNYFLCWEGFSGNPEVIYKNNQAVLEMLFAALPKGVELEIIVAFRRQDEFIQSIFTQFKHQNEKIELKDFIKIQYYEGLDWLAFLNRILLVFGKDIKLHVLPYEPVLFERRNIIQLLGDKLNLKLLKNVTKAPQRNVGFSERAENLYEQITPTLNSEYQSKVLRRTLQKVDNKGMGKEYNYLFYDEKLAFLKHYEESNTKLALKYWRGYDITDFSPPQRREELEQKKPTEELVIINLLRKIESNKLKLQSNIFFKVINKLSR